MWLDIVIPDELYNVDLVKLKEDYIIKYDKCENIISVIDVCSSLYIDLIRMYTNPFMNNKQYRNLKKNLQNYTADLDQAALVYFQIKQRQKKYSHSLLRS